MLITTLRLIIALLLGSVASIVCFCGTATVTYLIFLSEDVPCVVYYPFRWPPEYPDYPLFEALELQKLWVIGVASLLVTGCYLWAFLSRECLDPALTACLVVFPVFSYCVWERNEMCKQNSEYLPQFTFCREDPAMLGSAVVGGLLIPALFVITISLALSEIPVLDSLRLLNRVVDVHEPETTSVYSAPSVSVISNQALENQPYDIEMREIRPQRALRTA